MKEFIKLLLSNNTQSSMRFSLLTGIIYSGIIIGFILWLSVKYVSFGLDITIIDKLTYLVEAILVILVLGKFGQKFVELKYEKEKTNGQ